MAQAAQRTSTLLAAQLTPDDDFAGAIDRMNLKHRLRKVDANGRNLFHSYGPILSILTHAT